MVTRLNRLLEYALVPGIQFPHPLSESRPQLLPVPKVMYNMFAGTNIFLKTAATLKSFLGVLPPTVSSPVDIKPADVSNTAD